jgi:hypothetical protein
VQLARTQAVTACRRTERIVWLSVGDVDPV